MTSDTEYECINCGHEGYNTRAVPDAPELVRYSAVKRYGREEVIEKNDHGEYVLHSQAAAMLAAKDAQITLAETTMVQMHQELSSLEAELAQIKAQDPVVWRWKAKDGAVWSYNPMANWLDEQPEDKIDKQPLYAAPVASEDLKATNELLNAAIDDYNKEKAKVEVLREALASLRGDCQSPIEMYERNGPEFTSPQGNEYESTSYVVDKFSELVASIDTALSATEVTS